MNTALKTVALALLMGSAGFSGAQAQDRIGMMVIKFSGERNWSGSCSARKANGKSEAAERGGRGRRSTGSLTFRRITDGSCSVNVPEGTSLKVDITGGKSLVCPFQNTNPCSRTFAAGEGSFDFGRPD